MKTILATVAFAVFAVSSATTAQAAAGDLAKCYDRVIAACNKTNHAQTCAESGMDQCDEVYPTPMVFQPNANLRVQANRN